MKKTFYLFLLAAAPIVFNSCNSDDEEDNFVLKENSVYITNGGTTQIQFSGKLPSVKVANQFIATVNAQGLINAKHAGHTTATIGSKVIDIHVKGTNSLIDDICYEWGKGRQYVLSNTTFKDMELSSGTDYDTYMGLKTLGNTTNVIYGYLFAKNQDKLETVKLLVHKNYLSSLTDFLKERFYMAKYTNVIGNMLVGAAGFDSDDPTTATSGVTIGINPSYSNYYEVTIIPYTEK